MIEIILGLSIIVVACVSILMLKRIERLEELVDRRYEDVLKCGMRIDSLENEVQVCRRELKAFEYEVTNAVVSVNGKIEMCSVRLDSIEGKLNTMAKQRFPRKQKGKR